MIRAVSSVFFFCIAWAASAQPCTCDHKVVRSPEELRKSVAANPALAFVSLPQFIPGLVLDVRYATPGNFTKHVLYPHPAAWLRVKPAEAPIVIPPTAPTPAPPQLSFFDL